MGKGGSTHFLEKHHCHKVGPEKRPTSTGLRPVLPLSQCLSSKAWPDLYTRPILQYISCTTCTARHRQNENAVGGPRPRSLLIRRGMARLSCTSCGGFIVLLPHVWLFGVSPWYHVTHPLIHFDPFGKIESTTSCFTSHRSGFLEPQMFVAHKIFVSHKFTKISAFCDSQQFNEGSPQKNSCVHE